MGTTSCICFTKKHTRKSKMTIHTLLKCKIKFIVDAGPQVSCLCFLTGVVNCLGEHKCAALSGRTRSVVWTVHWCLRQQVWSAAESGTWWSVEKFLHRKPAVSYYVQPRSMASVVSQHRCGSTGLLVTWVVNVSQRTEILCSEMSWQIRLLLTSFYLVNVMCFRFREIYFFLDNGKTCMFQL
jgi:hypothetical protein